jgi:hypothetical protein
MLSISYQKGMDGKTYPGKYKVTLSNQDVKLATTSPVSYTGAITYSYDTMIHNYVKCYSFYGPVEQT